MRFIHYVAGDNESHKNVGKALRELKPGNYIIQIKKNKPVRSISQNKYYWAILNIIAISTGEHDRDELHKICARKFNGKIVELPSGAEQVGKETKNLDTAEFTAYVNRVKQWAKHEWNIIIPELKDVNTMRWMEIEDAYDQNFNS